MRRILKFLNPIARLGNTVYSFWFPLSASLLIILLSEIYSLSIVRDPLAVGTYIIFVHIAIIMYFSFRDGIRGGVVAGLIAVGYYIYIVYSRDYTAERFSSGINASVVLGVIYLGLAGVIGWLKQTIDVLIEREANERRRLQAIIAQLPVGVVITDEQGKVVEVNKKLDTLLGTKLPLGFQVGKTPLLETRYNGRHVSPSQGPIAQVLATGKAITGREMVITRKDGKDIYVHVSASPIRNRDGKIIAAASISTDMTQQKELELRKDDFVNMASHELKTPITSLKLYVETLGLRIKTDDEKIKKILARIKYQTENLQELVSDLLDVSRIQTGKLTFHKDTFSLGGLIEETIQGLQESTKHDITFNSKRVVNIHADRFRLYQVLTNLLTNAIKYSPEGKEIRVQLKRVGGKAVISVQDFGIGIPKDQHKKIFERLYQVTDPKEKTFPGLGMGLYISKEIVKRHKGNIWVESNKGKGSIFYVALPIRNSS